MNLDEKIWFIVNKLIQSRMVVVMTGSRLSVASGIDVFSEVSLGIKKYDPEKLTLKYFHRNPVYLWGIIYDYMLQRRTSVPNASHYVLSEMEKVGVLDMIITLDFSGLHRKAGSRHVIEFFGGLSHCYCTTCGNREVIDTCIRTECIPLTERYPDKTDKNTPVPLCKKCKGAMIPDIPLYDTALDIQNILSVEQYALSADLMLIVGTSLNIGPIGLLPNITKQHGGTVAIINDSSTTFDSKANMIFNGNPEEILLRILSDVKDEISAKIC
jgi:NAD-dependent deacetylase